MGLNLLKEMQVRQAKAKEKMYYLSDGGGLRLKILPSGTKQWIFRFMLNGKNFETTFSSYPTVTLTEAREKRDNYRKMLANGINPIEHNRKQKKDEELKNKAIFSSIIDEWLKNEALTNVESTIHSKKRLLERDVIPILGNKNINDINTDDILKILETKNETAPNLAEKCFNYFRSIFNYSVFKGYVSKNIFSNARDEKKYFIRKKVSKHYPKITDPIILKELVNDIYEYKSRVKSVEVALKFVLHIPLRANNLCNLKWEYIDLDNKILTIPRAEMKLKDINLPDFKLPLSNEVMEILKEHYKVTGYQKWVFLGEDNRNPINTDSPNGAIKRMGYNNEKKGKKIRLHGFRGTFRSLIETLDTDNKFSFEAKERALDHQEANKVVRAYSHKADYLNQLRPLMDFWSKYIVSLLD